MAYHVCFLVDGTVRVSEIWDSREQLDAFGQRLMPILAEVGVDVGEPEMLEIRNTIKRLKHERIAGIRCRLRLPPQEGLQPRHRAGQNFRHELGPLRSDASASQAARKRVARRPRARTRTALATPGQA